MKKYLIIPILLFASICFASPNLFQMQQAVIVKKNTSTACDTSQMSETGTATSHYEVAHSASYKYRATKLVYTGSTGQICTVRMYLYFVGSNAHTYLVALYSHDAGNDEPNTLITNGTSDGQDLSGIGGSETTVDFTFSSNPSLTNGMTYWVVIYSASIDNNDYVVWEHASDGTTERTMRSSNASNWSLQASTRTGKYVLFSN